MKLRGDIKMTIEELKTEMINRGCTKQSTESKFIPVVLSILTGNNQYKELADVTIELEDKKERLKTLESRCSDYARKISDYKELYSDYEAVENEVKRRAGVAVKELVGDTEEYLNEFFKVLNECETPEGRDAMRRAQMFINTINIDTKYDNTAVIIGLASILSNGNNWAMNELKKINNKLPNIPDDSKVYRDGSVETTFEWFVPKEKRRTTF